DILGLDAFEGGIDIGHGWVLQLGEKLAHAARRAMARLRRQETPDRSRLRPKHRSFLRKSPRTEPMPASSP
ncbi:hypothetical protein ACC734_38110, partial [Rhizobium ruizarguesonis]